MGFKDELKRFENELSQKRKIPSEISEEDVLSALLILNYMDFGKVPDAFLACACMNLLNAYKKQDNTKISYQYKRHLLEIVKGIEDIDQPKTIKIGYDNSSNMGLLIIQFWNFQFSFQACRYSVIIDRLMSDNHLQWDGFRKQPHALEIFDFAYSRTWISNQTMLGSPLREYVAREVKRFHDGGYVFDGTHLRKTSGITPAIDLTNPYLKNYMRVKLLKCTVRPVILSGVFRKVWEKHVTFTSVKPYIQGIKTLDICDHINLFRPDLERYISLDTLEFGKRYYIIGYCKKYPNSERMGVNLPKNVKYKPVFPICDFKRFPKDILAECHRFSIEEFIRNDQGKLTL